jgi:hypothetical protein
MKYVNDDDILVPSSSRVVLEVNERDNFFYRTLRDIVERTYRHTFHLQYKNKSNDSKDKVIHKLREEFLEKWSMRPMMLAKEKIYNNKKESF